MWCSKMYGSVPPKKAGEDENLLGFNIQEHISYNQVIASFCKYQTVRYKILKITFCLCDRN